MLCCSVLTRTYVNELQLCKRNTNVPAVFSFAGVFADSDDYLTGNFVPDKEDIPANVADDKV